MKLVDVVNFNADGSCLSADAWLAALEGGSHSQLYRWLSLYVDRRRKVTLGWVGATLADIAQLNPEALELVNSHPEIFEVLLRPFSHDVALLRTSPGFRRNADLGFAAIRRELRHVTPVYLPPEFMLTSSGVYDLTQLGVEAVLINSSRFGADLAERIPTVPYQLRGVFGSRLTCLPILGELTDAWLDSMHAFSASSWNAALAREADATAIAWRDGETFLFLPNGLAREAAWLGGEASQVERLHLEELGATEGALSDRSLPPGSLTCYPPHSFTEWFQNSRMLGFLNRLEAIEQRVEELTLDELALWLQAINSDVLSAVEKATPHVLLHLSEAGGEVEEWPILRSQRGFEGEEFLTLLERWHSDPLARQTVEQSPAPHLRKLRTRLDYLRRSESP